MRAMMKARLDNQGHGCATGPKHHHILNRSAVDGFLGYTIEGHTVPYVDRSIVGRDTPVVEPRC